MNTPNDRAVHVLNSLIETTLDSAHGYRKAAEGGDSWGQFNLGRLLAEEGQIAEATIWLRSAADSDASR